MRYRFLFFLLICFTNNISAQEKWTLQQCVDYALKNNVSVKQADIQSRISKITANQSRMNLYTNLNLNSSSNLHGCHRIFTADSRERNEKYSIDCCTFHLFETIMQLTLQSSVIYHQSSNSKA